MQITEPQGRWHLFRANLSSRPRRKSPGHFILLLLISALLAGSSFSLEALHNTAAQALADWQDTGIVLPDNSQLCVDGSQANTVFVKSENPTTGTGIGAGTTEYNWVNGKRTFLNSRPFDLCTSTGLLFTEIKHDNGASTAWRFSSADPIGREVDLMPTNVSDDGTLEMYSVSHIIGSKYESLWASDDGGLTWVERHAPFSGYILSVAASDTNGRVIYVAAYDVSNVSDGNVHFVIYFSSDAGVTWEARSTFSVLPDVDSYTEPYLESIPGNATPVDQFTMGVVTIYNMSPEWQSDIYVTSDGARTWQLIDKIESSYNNSGTLYHSAEGLVRQYDKCYGHISDSNCSLILSTDGGQSWQSLPVPRINSWEYFTVSNVAPWTMMFQETDSQGGWLYISHDGGHNWQRYSTVEAPIVTTPYLPFALLTQQDGHLMVFHVPDVGQNITSRLSEPKPSNSDVNNYFDATGHNLAPIFSDYWQTHGGLAQDGLPITEAFREVSDADGKVYTVQYFERAVFQYHPENDAPYKVLLGLLGTTEYFRKYGGDRAPGQAASTTNPLKFAQTGHTIGGLFRQYWEENGGLAQQGYPISDELQEQSVLDGKMHTVQYFERAVFELHLENAGTPYEVLLGQLGRLEVEAKYGSPSTP